MKLLALLVLVAVSTFLVSGQTTGAAASDSSTAAATTAAATTAAATTAAATTAAATTAAPATTTAATTHLLREPNVGHEPTNHEIMT
uniref:Mucin-like 1 n=1 Tax=Felis catus TaxID=9685 RepID=A0A0E4AZH7_FELCA|nr:mucin-like 1 [Felis catus]